MTSRVAIVAGNEILGMRFAIHINSPERVRPADVEDENLLEFRHLDDLGSIWCHKLTRPTGRFTACVRFKFIVPAIVVQRFRPRLVGCLSIRQAAATGAPYASFFVRKRTQADMTVGPTRSRLRRKCGLTTAARSCLSPRARLPLSLDLLTLASLSWLILG